MRPVVKSSDGVAFTSHGDLACVVYAAPARLHRSRWLYDLGDQVAAKNPGGILVLMVILPTADPPDAETRAENIVRMRKLGPSLRRFVTVPIGDAIHTMVVRTVMRALGVLQGNAKLQKVTSTLDEGIRLILEVRGPSTPTAKEIEESVHEMYSVLGWQAQASP